MLPKTAGTHLSEDPAKYWSQRAFDFGAPHPRLQVFRRLLEESTAPRATLLDAGCGPAALRRLLPPETEYFGVDIAPAIIHALGDPRHFEVADLNRVQQVFGGRRFDVVVCSGVLEYLADPVRVLSLFRRQLNPGGLLVLSYTNHQHWMSFRFWITGKIRLLPDPHLSFMTIPELSALLENAGFRILKRRALTVDRHELGWPSGHFSHFPFNLGAREFVFALRAIA